MGKYEVRRHEPPSQTERTFLGNHVRDVVAAAGGACISQLFNREFVFVRREYQEGYASGDCCAISLSLNGCLSESFLETDAKRGENRLSCLYQGDHPGTIVADV